MPLCSMNQQLLTQRAPAALIGCTRWSAYPNTLARTDREMGVDRAWRHDARLCMRARVCTSRPLVVRAAGSGGTRRTWTTCTLTRTRTERLEGVRGPGVTGSWKAAGTAGNDGGRLPPTDQRQRREFPFLKVADRRNPGDLASLTVHRLTAHVKEGVSKRSANRALLCNLCHLVPSYRTARPKGFPDSGVIARMPRLYAARRSTPA